MSNLNSIAAGWAHTLLVTDPGEIYGWGIGENGELGAEKGFVSFPAEKLRLGEINQSPNTQVAVGAKHTVILVDGQVQTMGSRVNGRLGHEKTHGWVKFPNEEKAITAIAAGTDFTVAIGKDTRDLYAWGLGRYGNLGDGNKEDRDKPVLFHLRGPRKPFPHKHVLQVSCGSRHALAVCTDGDVYSWGFGQNGRLGHGDQNLYAVPKIIEAFQLSDEQKIIEVAAGDSHSMARSKEGRVYSWGSGSYGRLGLGAENDQYVPKMIDKVKDCVGIACNAFHSLAVVEPTGRGSSLYTWGGGKYGKLGTKSSSNQLVPVEVPFFMKKNKQVVRAKCGLHHTVAVTINGAVYAWGYASNNRCGVNNREKEFYDTPTKISKFHNMKVVNKTAKERQEKTNDVRKLPKGRQVSAGRGHSVAVDEDRNVWAWGQNSYGQLGTGFHKATFKPIFVSRVRSVVRVSCGAYHTVVVTSKGSVYTWGNNADGQLGTGDTMNREFPALVEALQGTPISEVHAGHSHTAVVAKEMSPARVYLFGSNKFGQLGLGKNRTGLQLYPSPINLAKPYDEIKVAVGYYHTVFLGTNYSSEAGKGNAKNAANLRGAARIESIFETHLYTCGQGSMGQLGHDATVNEYTPRIVTGWDDWLRGNEGAGKGKVLPKISLISAGENSSMAVVLHERLEEVYAWGFVPGLDPTKRFHPKKVQEFDHDLLPEELGISSSVHHLVFHQIASANNHFLALFKYNNDRTVVFSWGETKYGKLGVGNVAKRNDQIRDRAARKNKMKSSILDDEEQMGSLVTNANFMPPAHVEILRDKDISSVSCAGDHSLAVSGEKSGTVYAWGYGNSGRLGLGEEEEASNKSEQQPREIPFFAHTVDQSVQEQQEEEQKRREEEEMLNSDDEDSEEERARDEKEVQQRKEARRRLFMEDEDDFDDFAHEDDGDDEVQQALDLKNLPKDRFEVIKYTNSLLTKTEVEYADRMDKYIKTLDDRSQTEEIIDLAIKERVKRAQELGYHRRIQPKHVELTPAARELLAAKAKKEAIRKRSAMDEIYVSSREELNPLESVVARFWMAPCLFMDMYNNCALFIRSKDLFVEGEEALKEDFTSLLFSVYNLHLPSDQRLMEYFLLNMMKAHIHDTTETDMILAPHTLEWRVLSNVFRSGKYQRRVRELLEGPLRELKLEGEDPCTVLKVANRDQHRIEDAVSHLVELGNFLFVDLTTSSVKSIMSVVGWIVEILFEAFRSLNRPDNGIIGRRILRALAVVGIEDIRMRRARNPEEHEDKIGLSSESEEFILHMLTDAEMVKEHASKKYATQFQNLPRGVDKFWTDRNKAKALDAYVNYIKANKQKQLGNAVLDHTVSLWDEQEKQRLILRDYMVARTIYKRKIIQLEHSARKLLIAFGYFELDTDDDTMFTTGSTNLRLDPFHVDRSAATDSCQRCGVWHPPVTYPKGTLDEDEAQQAEEDEKREFLDQPHLDEADVKAKFVLSTEKCSELWQTLKEGEFQDVVRTRAGEGAWKDIMRLIKMKRQEAFDRKNHEAVERYEEAARYLRRIKDAKPGTVVYLVSESYPALQEMVDPARLFDRLKRIDEQSERNQTISVHNVELYVDVVAALDREVRRAEKDAGEMKEVFAYITGTELDAKLQEFRQDERRGQSKLRKLEKIKVYKERGTYQIYSQQELFTKGILEKDPDRKNRVEAFCCLPLTCCKFLRTSITAKNQVDFYDQLEFHFLTTDSDDIFEVKLVYEGQLLAFSLVSLAILRGEEESLTKQAHALKKGVSPDCHKLIYEPQGDRVPITRRQTFVFAPDLLLNELQSYNRPHPRTSSEVTADVCSKNLANALQVKEL